MPRLADVLEAIDSLWPLAGAEPWDAPGLVSGDPRAEVTRVTLAVDAVIETAEEAVAGGSQLLLVHHPLLLRGVTAIPADRAKGAVLSRLIRGGCALVAAHTNADVVPTGTSAVLAERIGLIDTTPIEPSRVPGTGIGRVGRLPHPTTLGRLAGALGALLPATATGVRGSGDWDAEVKTVAVCAGAGDSLLGHPAVTSADVYVTSDLRHHPALDAREDARAAGRGPALLDVSHWAAEWLWLDVAAAELRGRLPELEVVVSETRTDPWDFQVTQ